MKKMMATLMALVLLLALLPVQMAEAASGGDIGSENALDALGIDTSKLPDGYDANSTTNPYGQSDVTINPVYELFVSQGNQSTDTYTMQNTLYGHNSPLNQSMDDFYSEQKGQTLDSESPVHAAATTSASGNFVGAAQAGERGQIVTVCTGDLSPNGGLYLYFTDPISGAVSSNAMTLIDTTRTIGNSGSKMEENFEESPYLMQNYLKVATGDFDNDGVDEVAVYVPEQGSSRVEIYKLQLTSTSDDDTYLTTEDWVKEWTYYFNESPYVSNMVSLTAGDFTEDGTADLALTWGYYYGPDSNNACQAIVLYGDSSKMLQKSQKISLSYNNTNIVRAAFTYGDIDGDNVDDLVLGGQLESDIAGGNINTRFLAVYNYDGTSDSFIQNTAQNFDLFKKENGQYVNTVMAGHGDKFYSTPACVTDIATVNMNGMGQAACIYLDSLLIENGSSGLTILSALDQNASFNKNANGDQKYYAEYGVVSADYTGSGKETLQVMQCYVPVVVSSTVTTTSYMWWWWFQIYNKVTITTAYPYDLDMLFVYGGSDAMQVKRTSGVGPATSYCKANTDRDTSLLSYTGQHYIRYTDPKVLAVIASPPYFADLDNDALSSTYMQSETAYTSTSGSGSGSTSSNTLNIGAYVSFEHDFTVFGVKVASVEAEMAYQHGWTWETSESSMLEQSISYSTSAGEDAVAFYSIPMEIYVYKSLVPIINETTGEITGYDSQYMSVNIPHTASVKVLSLDSYEKIAADYSDTLPQIAGTVFKHTVGDPASYPRSTNGYQGAITYSGDPSGVGFGLGTETQEISMSQEEDHSFTNTNTVDIKAGAGAGDFVFGISAGYEHGSSKVTITTSGSSFAGQLYNMPTDAEQYGYGFSWKIFSYEYDNGKVSFPVVDYLVSDVSAPPKLPADFEQDSDGTTDSQITLTWSYTGTAAGFQLYRYYEFPDGNGSYELAFVPASSAIGADSSGRKYYEYTDTGLDPYTAYNYQIQVVGAAQPAKSELSAVCTAKTKTNQGYPNISITGLTDNALLVYPDTNSTVSVNVENMSDYTQTPRYQWQKLTDEGWTDLSGATSSNYTFSSAGLADEGQYRCRVNAIYNSYYLSAYSEAFSVQYSKRTPVVVTDSFTVVDVDDGGQTVPRFSVSMKSAQTNNPSIPQGNVTFRVTGADYNSSFTTALEPSGQAGVSTASVTLDSPLPDGAYSITAYYEGSRVFKSLTTETPITYLAGDADGYVLTQDSTCTYGDTLTPTLTSVYKDSDGKTQSDAVTTGVTYELVRYDWLYTYNPYTYHWWFPYTLTRVPTSVKTFTSEDLAVNTVTADQAGSFTLFAAIAGNRIASKDFIVNSKEITVGIADQNAEAGTDSLTPTAAILKLAEGSTLAEGDTIADLGLGVQATNTAGNVVTIDSTTNPGSYTIIGIPKDTAGSKYSNYKITFVSGTYILTGPKYAVTASARDLNGKSVGTVELLTPSGNDNVGWTTRYANATTLVFKATPNEGYAVKDWLVTNDSGTQTEPASTTLSYQMKAEDVSVVAEFEVTQNTLLFQPTTPGTGTVECTSDTLLSSGSVAKQGAEFTFTATPSAGYHFVEWQLTEIGKNMTTPAGTLLEDGTDTCNITMGSGNMVLYAVFARDSYTLTLLGDLQATYTMTNELGKEQTYTVASGAEIQGDINVTVAPKPGYTVKEDAEWTQDDIPVTTGVSTDNQSYTFTVSADTSIQAETQNEHYGITVNLTDLGNSGNTVTATVNGASQTDLTDLAGGATVQLIATPAYGFVFDGWDVTGSPFVANGSTLTIPALSADTTVNAIFKGNDAYTITVACGERGSLSYTLNGGESTPVSSGESIPVFAGDTVVLTAAPDSNFMVDNWTLDGGLVQTNSKTQTLTNISGDRTVDVSFAAQTYSTVSYAVSGGGGTISAVTDGEPFDSGSNSVGNGSTLAFTASPELGKMVDHWTLNNVNVKNDVGGDFVGTTYTIPTLSSDSDVLVFYRDIQTHAVSETGTYTSVTQSYSPEFASDVRDGATATFTVTPDTGYRITDVQVSGNAGADGLNGFSSITKTSSGSWICVVNAVTDDLSITSTAEKIYYVSIPVTPVGGKIQMNTTDALAGETISIKAIPYSSYVFAKWTVADAAGLPITTFPNAESASATFSMPATDVTVGVAFSFVDSGSNIGGGGGSTGGSAAVPQITTTTEGTGTNAITTLSASVTGTTAGGTTTASLDQNTMQALISGAGQAETAGERTIVNIAIPAGENETGAEITLPGSPFDSLASGTNADLRITSGIGIVSFDSAAVESIGSTAQGDVRITMAQVDTSDLSTVLQQTVGDRPVYHFSVNSNGQTISSFGDGSATVTLPYSLGQNENPNAIVVYYVNDSGTLQVMQGKYDNATGTVTFVTTHFSNYVIGYHKVTFNDVADSAWCYDAVTFCAAREITSGTSANTFSPNMAITRGQFLVMLLRACGISPLENPTDNFDDAGDTYYTGYLAAAKSLGISFGVGNNLYAPNREITRQQMFTLLYNTLKVADRLPQGDSDKTLSDFSDADQMEPWAKDAMTLLVAADIVHGNGDKLNPTGTATRAQLAQILYNLFSE